jgi:hypothetical protein
VRCGAVRCGAVRCGAVRGAGLGLATGPITYVSTAVVAPTMISSESFGGSSVTISSSPASNGSTTTASIASGPPHCVVSGAGSKDLDRCLSKVASARGTMTPTLPRPQVDRCEKRFARGVGTITFVQPSTRTFRKGLADCVGKGMARVKLMSEAAMRRRSIRSSQRVIGVPACPSPSPSSAALPQDRRIGQVGGRLKRSARGHLANY